MESGISEEDVLKLLEEDHARCKKQCKEIQEQISAAKAFESEKKIKDITLPHDAKLIDLLIHRILDKEDDWRLKITELINIPHSLKGVEWLRGGDYFEALFQLAIAVGLLPELSGKIKFHDVKKYKDLREFPNYLYEKTVKNSGGGEQGISDITFEIDIGKGSKAASSHKCGQIPQPTPDNGNPFYFISVKGYVKSEKSIKDDYDIPLLSQQLKEFADVKNKRLIVCVRNKDQFIKRLDRSRIEFLRSSVHKVIGYDEIMDAFAVFRTNFFIRNLGEGSVEGFVRREFPPGEVIHKPSLTLYFHQELVVKSVINRIQDRKDLVKPHFMCIGVLPRGGKSFIAGGIIDAHRKIKNKDKYNVLFLTSAVNETREQFREDLIQKFSEFSDFEFRDVVNLKRPLPAPKPNKFFFVSRQLSSIASDPEYEESIIKTLETRADFKDIDICFFDEAHVGIKSENVRETFRKLFESYKIPVIMMTATFSKPAQVLDDDKDLFVWDLQDVKDMNGLSALGMESFIASSPDLLMRYPDISESILATRIGLGQTESQIARPYVDFPVPNFISLTFADKTIDRLKELGEGYEYEKAFQIKKDASILNDFTRYGEWASLMGQPDHAKNLREFLTPDIEEGDSFLIGQSRKFRALNQVFTIAHSSGSRPLPGQPFSMIMFLPMIEGSPIGALCRVWASFMQMSPYWKNNFVFMALSVYSDPGHVPSKMTAENAAKHGFCSRENFKDIPLKEAILQVEYEALKLGKGLVLLSGDVAKMGISLPCVDVVCLMTTGTDADDIIQKMYRALTDNPPTKKNGYIIDLNLKRIVTAMLDYDVEKTRRSPGDKKPDITVRINKILELCNWGQDAFIQANAGQKDFNDLMADIRGLVASGIKERFIARSFVREVLEKKQIQIIFDDPALKGAMMLALKDTAPVNKKSKSKKTLLETGSAIPGVPDSEAPEEGLDESVPAARPPPVIELSLEDLKKKTMNIVTTFINALVIKSSKSWGIPLNYADLISKYREDEKTVVRPIECDCSKSPSCSKTHDNLYETAWCELKSYAMKRRSEDTYEYSPETHEQIMKAMDMTFDKSGGLEVDWNGHIEDLVESLKGQKSGGRRRKQRTWKNGKHSIRRNGLGRRQTHRNTRHH